MKFALAQLRKLSLPYTYEEELDLSSDLCGTEDILKCDTCYVKTTINMGGDDTYLCEFEIKINLTLEDSITLDEIPYNIDVNSSELYTKDETIEDATYLDTETLDTKEAIIQIILSEKPMAQSLTSYEEENEEEEEYINPAFASLKDLL